MKHIKSFNQPYYYIDSSWTDIINYKTMVDISVVGEVRNFLSSYNGVEIETWMKTGIKVSVPQISGHLGYILVLYIFEYQDEWFRVEIRYGRTAVCDQLSGLLQYLKDKIKK